MAAIVQAPCGQLRGVELGPVTAFLGVPYAVPPLGALRWKPPQRLSRWDGVRDATRKGARAIQHAPYGELEPDNQNMDEDCLFLNIWTPSLSRTAKLPVLFWLHGGEFWAGSGTEPRYDGRHLAERGAVIVTINYRLGVFGFLAHPELSAEASGRKTSGNYGLLDQILALRWTGENIAAFGGDPENTTIGGESAGSCSVSFLMASSLSKGMFHRAIGESCAYFMPEAHAMKPLSLADHEQRGISFMRAVGAHGIHELRALPGEKLQAAWMLDTKERMQPCVDGYVLPQVEEEYSKGQQARVPLLCGWNGDEYGFMRAGRDKFDAAAFRNRLARSFGTRADSLLEAYASNDPLETATQLTSDRAMVWPTWKWAEEQTKVAPVFVYQFDRSMPGIPFGATHASELEYVFGTLDSKGRLYTKDDRELSERIGEYWLNFLRDGDPNGDGLPPWPKYDAGVNVMYLDRVCRAAPFKIRARIELLDRLYRKLT